MSKRVASVALVFGLSASAAMAQDDKGLWSVYDEALKSAKYIDLTRVIGPNVPVWYGFGPSTFEPAKEHDIAAALARSGSAPVRLQSVTRPISDVTKF
jgi:hypothetical protein